MTPEEAAKLREAFPPEVIGKLPRVTCRACSDRNTNCQEHRKTKCGECGNYISTAHIHLDYVGHAAATDRLLQVDPEWTWEPVATDPTTGAPVISDYGLWIKLTVCGVTRYGWGDGKNIKEMISDAIRNAAMRFGVALDLWAKEDLQAMHDESERGDVGRAPGPAAQADAAPSPQAASADPKEIPAEYADLTDEDVDAMPPPAVGKALLALGEQAAGTVPSMRAQLKRRLGV